MLRNEAERKVKADRAYYKKTIPKSFKKQPKNSMDTWGTYTNSQISEGMALANILHQMWRLHKLWEIICYVIAIYSTDLRL